MGTSTSTVVRAYYTATAVVCACTYYYMFYRTLLTKCSQCPLPGSVWPDPEYSHMHVRYLGHNCLYSRTLVMRGRTMQVQWNSTFHFSVTSWRSAPCWAGAGGRGRGAVPGLGGGGCPGCQTENQDC
jgi:hypothetical protein